MILDVVGMFELSKKVATHPGLNMSSSAGEEKTEQAEIVSTQAETPEAGSDEDTPDKDGDEEVA